jgi:protein phosphatase PTC7
VREGDVVVLATDGVTDNLFDEELLTVVRFGGTAEEIAHRIAKFSSEKANSLSVNTPFASAIKQLQLGQDFEGGKLDDITVCVGLVVKAVDGGFARL